MCLDEKILLSLFCIAFYGNTNAQPKVVDFCSTMTSAPIGNKRLVMNVVYENGRFSAAKVNLVNANGAITLQHSDRHKGGFDTFDFNTADQIIANGMRKGGHPTSYHFFGYGKGRIHITKPSILKRLKY